MASIPCSSRHSVTYTKDVENLFKKQAQTPCFTFTSQPIITATGLQYFNMRITQRLRRYRSMKKEWQEVATSVQKTLSPTCESPISQDATKNLPVARQKSNSEPKTYCINDYINATIAVKDNNDKNVIEIDPLHSRIQQDLIKLRKFIKAKQRKSFDNLPLKTPTSSRPSGEATSISAAFDDQENRNIIIIRKASSSTKLKPLDRVKIAGCQMRPPILPKSDSTDSGIGSSSNPSSTCSQYSKQQQLQQQQQQQQQQKPKRHNKDKAFSIYHTRINPVPPPPPPLPSSSFFYRSSFTSKKKSNTPFKMSQNIPAKQLIPSRLSIPIPPVVEKKQPSFTKQEILLPPIQRQSTNSDITSRLYTYAASSSSATPRSMMLKRNTSLLPILLQSCSCIGIQPREVRPKKIESNLEEEQEENNNNNNNDENDDDYYHLLNYNHLINRLPKPVVSIIPRYGQDDYGILFEQLDHIRETMPDSNIYDDYARIG